MKQYITIEQFRQLSQDAQEKARTMLPKQMGSRLFAELSLEEPSLEEYNGIYTGVVVSLTGTNYQVIYETTGTTGPTKYLKNATDYPLFSFGELLQIVSENQPNGLLGAFVDVDDLWEKVKRTLEH